jgi:GNAT superfamily N-acetyltransferase
MLIRRIQTADAMAVKRLRLQALTQEPLAFAMDVTQAADWADAQWVQMASRNSDGVPTIVLAQVGTELVGMVGCHLDSSPKMTHCGMVWGMYVAPAQRNHGIARQLLQAVIDHGSAHHLQMLKLSVTTTQTSALRGYLRAGFVQYAHEPALLCVDGVPIDAFHLYYRYDTKESV